ncbi:MAG: hypothetical protein R3335_14725, partial [Anaerolineales bacterium]|nr:hypothetical protein [Anaerolineales bacterium]
MERIAFLEKLLEAAQEPSKKINIAIALRADFYAHCAQYPLLRQSVAARQEYIGQMTAEDLRRTIEEPAKRAGWHLEPGLVDVLLNDVGAQGTDEPEPGALPLLSHALLATWELRRGRTFTLEGYLASGGVRGAIAETAESVFKDQLNQDQQEIAREVFLRLTKLGEGTEDTRRRVSLNELVRQTEEAAQLRAVLNTLAEARLITLNEDSAEVAHEALIREWQRLHDWLTLDREGLILHRHLTESTQEWEIRGRDPAELYRGARLAQAVEWASVNDKSLNEPERDFLAASVDQEQHEVIERESQRKRELEAAQKLALAERQRAEEQSRNADRLKRRAIYLSAVLVFACVAALTAGIFAYRADTSFTGSEARRLAAEANNLMQSGADPQLIALLSLQSIKTSHTLEGDTALSGASRLAIPLESFIAPNNQVWSAEFSQDGRLAATVSVDTIQIWDLETGREKDQFRSEIEPVHAIFSPDSKKLLVSGLRGIAQLIDADTGQIIQEYAGHQAQVVSSDFSSDGRYAVTASLDQTAILWDVSTGDEVRRFRGHTNELRGVAFSPDDRLIATTGVDQTARLWSVDSGEELQIFLGHTREITSLDFSPDGETILTGSHDKTARIWDVNTGEELLQLIGHRNLVNTV